MANSEKDDLPIQTATDPSVTATEVSTEQNFKQPEGLQLTPKQLKAFHDFKLSHDLRPTTLAEMEAMLVPQPSA